MLFNSIEFLIFFPIVCLIFWTIPQKSKKYWLLLASYYFYMCWNAKYALLILTSTVVTYISGLAIESCKGKKKEEKNKKLVVAASFSINLFILFYFKYTGLFIDTLVKALGKVNIEINQPSYDIILPVGISFYTFQALSYTMDVYRDEIKAENNFVKYALFVSFFPQLVAGPIERSKNLLGQLDNFKPANFDRIKEGFLLMLWGFFLKLVMADRIAIFVDNAYNSYNDKDGMILMIATALFAVQIYCDFYGYSTIAIGTAYILGIELMENFQAPYLSATVAEFWRRWHISLTSWFKDYLYIPLGGSRKGKVRKNINRMIVFLVSGLWHGADWSFVLWGGINGLYQVLGDLFSPLRSDVRKKLRIKNDSKGLIFIQVFFTFILVDFAWIFFRASSISQAFGIIKRFVRNSNINAISNGDVLSCGLDLPNCILLIICIIILVIADVMKKRDIKLRYFILNRNILIQICVFSFIISGILLFGIWGPGYSESNFIYFQF